MTSSLLDDDGISLVRAFVGVYGADAYERLCDRFAGQPDEHLISNMKRALYGSPQENDPRAD